MDEFVLFKYNPANSKKFYDEFEFYNFACFRNNHNRMIVFQISELDQMKNNRPEAIIQENKCYGFEFFFPKSNFFIETLISFTLLFQKFYDDIGFSISHL